MNGIEDVVTETEAKSLQQIRFLYVDNGGTIRGKVIYKDHLRGRMTGGIGLTPAMQAMNMLDQLQDIPEMGPVGEVRLIPDPDSFRVLPYLPSVGEMMCDMIGLNHEPWAACPRTYLKRVIQKATDVGLSVMATYEDEFTLAYESDDGVHIPIDRAVCFSSSAMDIGTPVIADIMEALAAQGIIPEQYYPELGHGQHELSISPTDLLTAADNQVRYRDTVRAVAAAHGMVASFAPKPFVDQAGNGAHIHFSLWTEDWSKNLMWDADDKYHVSDLGYRFAAGILDHLPGLVGVTCASVNSYRRLNPSSWSSAYTSFGPDNREAAVRIASTFWGNEEKSMNMELKASDSTANPYLALAALVDAGLDGVARKLPPATPILVDPSSLSDEDRERLHIHRLPSNLDGAMDALELDPFFRASMGDLLFRSYTTVKRSEARTFAAEDTAFELKHHFSKF